MIDRVKAKKRQGSTDVDVARTAERQQANDQPDPFPEEGTDEKTVQGPLHDKPLSEDEAVTATRAVIDAGLSGSGKTAADWSDGRPPEALDDGTGGNALSNSDVSEAFRRRGLTGGDDNVLSSDTQETRTMATATPTATAQGTVLKNVPFAEHLNKLPEPVKNFIHRRPGTAIGIAALAGLALLVAKPIRR